VVYLRGKVSKLFRDGEKIMVKGVDTLSNRTVEIEADLVVLATAMVPRVSNRRVAEMLDMAIDENDFYSSSNEELEPVSSSAPGVYMAGAALGPKDIPETVSQASGAAAKVLSLFQKNKLTMVDV
jgi:heterodisulfide reductase subunit A